MTDAKRKVNGSDRVAAEEIDDRSSKRRKIPNDTSTKGETPETTKIEGLKALEHIKSITDKRHIDSGRPISTDFLTLPSKKKFPDYYKFTKLPIAIDVIENKLKRHDFDNLTQLESWFKRMASNAKEYNEKGSVIYDDAEKLRKAFSSFMTKVNPDYKVPGFQVQPVPVPGAEDVRQESEHEVEEIVRKGRGGRQTKAPAKSPPPSVRDLKYADRSFSGLSFQQAQEKVVEDMIHYRAEPEDEYADFEVFVDLPAKSLKEYYAIIQDPRSLKTLWKQVHGMEIDRKTEAAGVSKFANWDEFEAEASIIWANACHYNEDGSGIFKLAKDLESAFGKDLDMARKYVPGPPAPKKITLKINANKNNQPTPPPPRITLKMSRQASPPALAGLSNGINDNAAAATDVGRRNPFGGFVATAAAVPSLDPLDRARSMSGSVASPTVSAISAVKNEDMPRTSPALAPTTIHRASSQAASTPGLTGMHPPSTPGFAATYPQTGGYTQSFSHPAQYPVHNSAFDTKWRQPGKNASDAMISNLNLSTHPGLNIQNHLNLDLPPSDTMAQQSLTVNLPSTQYFVQIKPTIAPNLLERQHKLFVTLNHQRLPAMPLMPGHTLDPRYPLFEGRLSPGVNRLEIELIASLPKGAPKPENGAESELEKITVFANLMKAT
ncbi:Bromodomain-containing protein-like protein [Calycina marina]|uniref:Bromodomain-containing protein-like protein n=1 Tax=Calycina marina TaxID=1763456 RepID=A0A9P8CH87_9HELO|nr:Bromodomain-containing protein-like protein [Calycina marina]